MKMAGLILALFLAFLPLAATAVAAEPAAAPPAERVLAALGAEERFVKFMTLMAAAYGRHAAALPPTVAEKFTANARTAHAAEKLYPVFREEFAKTFDPAGTKDVVAWLESEAGRRTTAAEQAALKEDAAAAFPAQLPSLLALPEARKGLVRQYLAATGAERHAATLVTIPLRVYADALRRTVPAPDRGDDTEYARRTQELEADAVRQYLVLLPASTAFTFRDLSDDDFSAMLGFCRSTAGSNLTEAIWAGTGAALRAAAAELGEANAAMLQEYLAVQPDKLPEP